MGQYYLPISIDKMEYVESHDYNNGLKLMEHSWIGNEFMRAVETLIAKGGRWHGDRIVWAGDYADKEKASRFNEKTENLYDMVNDDKKIKPTPVLESYKYIVNLDKRTFVDLDKVPVSDISDGFKFRIHPLSLLTCEGNGKGGGDFHGKDKHNLIGSWARDRIVAQNEFPEGFRELKFNLKE